MVYGPRKIKKSQFTGGTVSNSSTLDFVKDGLNQKQEWSGFLADIAEVFGASFRVYEFTSELVASDIALGEYALVEETSYGLYKITSNAATGNDIALDSGFTATWENQLGGFVIGPASSTDDAVAIYDGTSGALLKDGPAISSLALASDVATNTAAIATNAAAISTNSTNIATNSTNITNNTDEISRINSKEVADYAEALALTPADYEAGEIIYITDDGIAGPFKVVASAISASSTGVQLSNATWNAAGKHLKRSYKGSVYGTWFGMLGNSTDDTAAFTLGMSHMNDIGGGTFIVPAGTSYLSIAESDHANVCVLIPKNTKLKGYGKKISLLQRLPAERGTNGVLLCNKNYDLITNYGADGNITIEDIGITDGATTPNRGLGDLIGFGNGDGLTVQNCWFGNHDQHAIDICKSRNVFVRWNESENAVTQASSATYQIDAGLIWGIAGGTIGSESVYIYENKILDSRANNVIHFHSECYAKNVYIFRNEINGENLGAGQSAIGGDTDCSYENVHIFQNAITLNHVDSRGINLPIDDSLATTCDRLRIYKNDIAGAFRIAVYAGLNSTSRTDYDGPLKSVVIKNNTATADLTSAAVTPSTGVLMFFAGYFNDAEISNNTVNITINGQTAETRLFVDWENRNITMNGNKVYQQDSGATAPAIYYPIQTSLDFCVDNSLHKRWDISDNYIDANNCRYHLFTVLPSGSIDTFTNYSGTYSRNRFKGTPAQYNMYEAVPVSDGTNNLGYVDFTSHSPTATDPFVKQIASATFYSGLPLTGTKNSQSTRIGQATLDILYSPSLASLMISDTEEINSVYLSSTDCVGTMTADIDFNAGTFSVLTGKSGTSMVINNSTFEPVIRTGGFIKVLCGI